VLWLALRDDDTMGDTKPGADLVHKRQPAFGKFASLLFPHFSIRCLAETGHHWTFLERNRDCRIETQKQCTSPFSRGAVGRMVT